LTQAIETSEQVKEHIKREEEMIRRKTAEALQLKAQWKSAQIQNEMEKALGAMGQFEQAETAFGRAKEKITQTHHESRARAELGKGRVETRLAGLEDIERSAAAEAELAELELKLGLSSAPLPQQTATASVQTDVERQLAELEAKLGTGGGSGSTSGSN
jgi:phage shock protein A